MSDNIVNSSFDAEEIINLMQERMSISKSDVLNLLNNSSEKYLLKLLKETNFKTSEIDDIFSVIHAESSRKSNLDSNVPVRSFEQQTTSAVARMFFSPVGGYDADSNGQVYSDTSSICSSDCDNIITGSFYSKNGHSLISYTYIPNIGLRYTVGLIEGTALVKVATTTIPSSQLPGLSGSVQMSNIDVNGDGLDDIILSVRDSSCDNDPLLLLNQGEAVFGSPNSLDIVCSNQNGGYNLYPGYFFGPKNPGLWLLQSSGMNYLYSISGGGISLEIPKTNWCSNGKGLVIDFNGDKFDDMLCLRSSNQNLLLSLKGEFLGYASTNSDLALFDISDTDLLSNQFIVGDFDGNGKEDFLRNDPVTGKKYAYLSSGQKFFGYQKQSNNDPYYISIASDNFCKSGGKLSSGDYNNDKKTDLWCSNSQNDYILLSRLESDYTPPKVFVSLTYRNFNVQIPNDLSAYNSSVISSSRYVNAKDVGKVNFSSNLSIDLKLSNSMDSYAKDILQTENVLGGKVLYLSEYQNSFAVLSHTNYLSGYKLDSVVKAPLEFDWRSAPKYISTNIISPWDEAKLHSQADFSIYPNRCVEAQMAAYVYKNVPIPYTAEGFAQIKDEYGVNLSGEALKRVAEKVFVNPVRLNSLSEVVFDTTGTINHNIVHNIETSFRDCPTLSALQSATSLPKVIVSLTYRDFEFTKPQNYADTATQSTISSYKEIKNSKKYGSVDFNVPLSLEVKLSQSIDSFYSDLQQNNIVIDGEVSYAANFNDIQLLFGGDLSGYVLDNNKNLQVKHSWFTPVSKISSEIFSSLDKLKVSDIVTLTAVPNQCIALKMKATLNHGVKLTYNANGYFTAKTEDGYPITGSQLLAVGDAIFDKDVQLDSNGEVFFATSGTLTRNIIGDISTEALDC